MNHLSVATGEPIVSSAPIPRSIFAYGLLGLIPFIAPPLLALRSPAHAGFLAVVEIAYAALILSFLGGARWGLEVARPVPRVGVITLAMLPTIAALALLLGPLLVPLSPARQLTGMVILLAVHLVWDATARGLPAWYPRLRGMLTLAAIFGLMVMAGMVQKAAEGAGATV